MTDDITAAVREVEAYLDAKGMKASTFGRYAARDDKFLDRLRRGVVSLNKLAAARAYMAENPAPKKRAA